MGKAILDVSYELLREWLYLPEDVQVLMATRPKYPHTMRLIVEGPQFPETMNGQDLPITRPSFRKVEERSTSKVVLIDWGLSPADHFA